MRIAVNAQLFPSGPSYRSAGVARYVKELVDRLPEVAPEHDFVFFVPPATQVAGGIASRIPTSNPVVRIGWEQLVEPVKLRNLPIDVLHSPVNVLPFLSRTPGVVTIHDLTFVRFPSRLVPWKRGYQTVFSRLSMQRASRVIVPSEATGRDAIGWAHLDPSRVAVVPEGVGPEFRVDHSTPRPIPEPYILYVGTIEPRKNLPQLIQAFSHFKRAGRPHVLVLLGPDGWMVHDVDDAVRAADLGQNIRRIGYIENLAPWYNHAEFFVYPSLYEGFGLPPLEAMACGAPVVLSRAGSLREVAGDAALYFEPLNTAELIAAMGSISDDKALRERLSAAGVARAAQFSWDTTARRTVEVYESAVGQR